jgi:hypothetical protein
MKNKSTDERIVIVLSNKIIGWLIIFVATQDQCKDFLIEKNKYRDKIWQYDIDTAKIVTKKEAEQYVYNKEFLEAAIKNFKKKRGKN